MNKIKKKSVAVGSDGLRMAIFAEGCDLIVNMELFQLFHNPNLKRKNLDDIWIIQKLKCQKKYMIMPKDIWHELVHSRLKCLGGVPVL